MTTVTTTPGSGKTEAAVCLPAAIEKQLERGAALAINVSGGKDSQAMALTLARLHRERGWKGECFLINADLGRIEWPQTHAQLQAIAAMTGLRLVTVRHFEHDMIGHWRARGDKMRKKGQAPRPWSGPGQARFCTSDMKRDPINKYLRRYSNVVSAIGIRAQESDERAKQPEWARNYKIDNTIRTANVWHPLLHWTLLDVLRACGTTFIEMRDRQAKYAAGDEAAALDGWALHPAYVMGNERLSCQFCVLGSLGDLQNAARHRPELLTELVAMEDEYGFTFKNGWSLKALQPAA